MTEYYEMPLGPLGGIIDKLKFAKSAEKGMENALYNVRGLLEGNGSIPVYITLDAYQKLLAEKKKMKTFQFPKYSLQSLKNIIKLKQKLRTKFLTQV